MSSSNAKVDRILYEQLQSLNSLLLFFFMASFKRRGGGGGGGGGVEAGSNPIRGRGKGGAGL